MNAPKLSARLLAAADFVRQGSFVADVGTDHAYLPIYLCSTGKIRGAVASDVNEGPVQRAKINIRSYKLDKKISVLLTDGLRRIDILFPDDILICGMGGELISRIVSEAEWTKERRTRLILQPMTHAEALREYLNREGYSIIGERLVKEDKIYQIICAEYTGKSEEYSDIELIFGKRNLTKGTELLKEYAEFVRSVLATRRDGKLLSGADVSYEEKLLREIDGLLANN
ncbi:MAG: SAM-dependent methyltransferase [Clostridia bacterium]|nr:SAM-dependent methyltransferase [Clostridia bacterium]